MFKWFADSTDINLTHTNIPNVIVFGGIIIDDINEDKLIKIIKNEKSKYTYEDMPIKWNFRNLKSKYEEFGKLSEYENMLSHSYEWRKEIFSNSIDIDYTVIISIIENFQTDKSLKETKEIKRNLIRYCFSNALMRFGYFIRNRNQRPAFIILDWPDSHDAYPYNREFYYAYNRGHSLDKVPYNCGKLSDLGFYDCVFFNNMTHSNSLQFADLIIGAVKEFIDSELDNSHSSSLGKDLTKLILPKFYGYPRINGYGLVTQNKELPLYRTIRDYFKDLM